MPQVRTNGTITDDGTQYLAQKTKDIEPVVISHFLLAKLPGVDETTEADPTMTMGDVPAGNIVGSNYPMYRIGYADDTHVAYSLHLDSHQGDFDFNWVGMITDSGVLFAFVNIPLVKKRKGIGQVINRNLLLSYSAARVLNPAAIPAETWQFDYTEILGSLVISLTGENWIHLGESKQYTINDFDDMGTYTAGTDTGTATLNGRVITLEMPDSESTGMAHLLVSRNGFTRDVPIEVRPQTIAPPVMQTPVNGATELVETPILTVGDFHTYPANVDTHRATDWQVLDADDNVVWESLENTADLLSITMPDSILNESTVYKFRARFRGNTLPESQWSEVSTATTTDVFYKPGATVNGDIVVGQMDGYWLLVAPKEKRGEDVFSQNGGIPIYKPESDVGLTDTASGYERTEYRIENTSAGNIPAFVNCHNDGYFLPNRSEVHFLFDNSDIVIDAEDGGNYGMQWLLDNGKTIITSTDANDAQRYWVYMPYSSTVRTTSRIQTGYVRIPMRRVPV